VSTSQAAPALFLAHGSPLAALANDSWSQALRECGTRILAAFPALRAALVVSAHWQNDTSDEIMVGTATHPETIHDFGGFPRELFQITYPAPGSPAIAQEVITQLRQQGLGAAGDPSRGLDHGCWVPLRQLLPLAQLPVVPVSLPRTLDEKTLSQLGKALGGLRDRGCLLIGSGAIVHNLRRVSPRLEDQMPEGWAMAFEQAVVAAVTRNDLAALLNGSLSEAATSAPTLEHLAPLPVVMAARLSGDRVQSLTQLYHHRTLAMRSFAFSSLELAGVAAR
jgi:4,5-DOPA dioxygenase extradiol